MDHRALARTLDECAAALAEFGMDVTDNVVQPPATEAAVAAVESELGHPLPASMRAAFLSITQEVEWSWWVPQGKDLPAPFEEIFSGSTWFRLDLLPLLNEQRQQVVEAVFPDPHDPAGEPWRHSLPFCAVGNGDYLAVDLRPTTAGEVLYLEPHGLADAGQGYRMARSLSDLLERWSPLGQPGPDFDQWRMFAGPDDGLISPRSEAALGWRALVGLP